MVKIKKRDVKRFLHFAVLLGFIFTFFLISVSFVSAENNCFDSSKDRYIDLGYYNCLNQGFNWMSNDIPLIDNFRYKLSQNWGYFISFSQNKTGWALGFKTWQGENIINFTNLIICCIFCMFFWCFVWGMIKFNPNSSNTYEVLHGFKKWYNYLFGFFAGAFIYFFFNSLVSNYEIILFSLFILVWFVIFEIFWIFILNEGEYNLINVLLARKISYVMVVSFSLFYIIFINVPIINRILQIVTLEFLGIGWFLRSFIVASVIYFIPYVYVMARSYLKRRKIYQSKLKKVVGEEYLKSIGKS